MVKCKLSSTNLVLVPTIIGLVTQRQKEPKNWWWWLLDNVFIIIIITIIDNVVVIVSLNLMAFSLCTHSQDTSFLLLKSVCHLKSKVVVGFTYSLQQNWK